MTLRQLVLRGADGVLRSRRTAYVGGWDTPLVPRPGARGLLPAGSSTQSSTQSSTGSTPQPSTGSGTGSGTRSGTGSGTAARRADGLRVVVATESIDVGGMDEVVASLAAGLGARGVQVVVLHAPRDQNERPGRLADTLARQGLPVVTRTSGTGPGWMADWRPDVVSVHGAPDWVVDSAVQLGVPVVETLHGAFELLGGDLAPVRRRMARMAGVVAVSELVREQYLAACPELESGRIATVPNGVRADVSEFPDRQEVRAALGLGQEHLFVSLARFCLQKNTFGLVRAFNAVADARPEAQLVIAGRPDDLRYTRRVRRAVAGRHRSRVHLRDHLAQPLGLLAAADTFVLNSFFEGWSLASMEAVAAGVPAILSDVGGAREQLEVGTSVLFARYPRGYLLPNPLGDPSAPTWAGIGSAKYAHQDNHEALVAAMVDAVQTRRDWAASRAERIAAVAGSFSQQRMLDRHLEILERAAHAFSGSGP